MKTLLAILLVCILNSASAKTYYVSNSGNDVNSGLTTSTPWKTLAKVSSFTGLVAGDAVLFNRGGIFYGKLTIKNHGSSGNPITFGAYGSGTAPVITGLTTVSSWTNLGSNIWESSGAISTLPAANMVVINGVNKPMGRYPNTGYATVNSHSTNTSITSSSLTGSPNWAGAEVVIRKNHWVLDRNLITGQSGSRLTYNFRGVENPRGFPASADYATDGYGFFIQNDSRTLDVAGEWYYNRSTKKIRVYSLSSPANVKVSTVDTLVYVGQKNYITFDNLSFQGANVATFQLYSCQNTIVQNCSIDFSGGTAMQCRTAVNLTIRNTTINHTNDNAIRMDIHCANAYVGNNTIKNTGVLPGMGAAFSRYSAIVSPGNNSIIEYNKIDSTGFIGINFLGNSVLIRNNFINVFCMTIDDGGAIYSWNGANSSGVKVLNNIVLNGIGAPDGTANRQRSAEGIYLDGNCQDIEISGNTVANCAFAGMFIHSSYNIKILNNTIYNNDYAQIYLRHGTLVINSPLRNILMKKNIVISKTSLQPILHFSTIGNDISLMGTVDSNYYARPIDDNLTFWTDPSGPNSRVIRPLAGWQSYTGHDAHSKKSPKTITTVNDLRLEYNATTASKTIPLDGNYIDVKNVSYNGSITLAPYTSAVLIRNGAATNQSPTANAGIDKAITLPTSTINLSGSGTDPDGTISAYNWTKISGPASGTITNATLASTSVTGLVQGIYQFQLEVTDNNGATDLGTVQITVNTAPTVSITTPINNATFASPASVTISATAADADGTITKVDFYNGTTLLGSDNTSPYTFTWNNVATGIYSLTAKATDNGSLATASSAVAISVYTPNGAPTVGITSPVNNATFASPASVTISATAADADGTVTKVDFYNGTTLLGSDNTSPYTFTWNNVATGIYSLTAKATDNGALATASSAVVFSIYTPNVAPTVGINSPVDNATFASPASVTISATAADADGTVTKVDFYNGTTLLGSDNTSPYTFTWNNVATGIYSLTAKATDNGSLVTTSSDVVFSVYTPNGAPTASIATPINNATFASPASVTISATAADADGTITKVDFYNGTTLLGSDNTSPYTFTWNNVATGIYSLTAKATDNGSLATASSAVAISVYTPNGAPTVGITSPVNNATFASPASVTISAIAADADGTVTKVDFYNGTTLLGSDNTSPYTFTWNNVATGNYSLTAKATDNGALATASSAVVFSIYTPNVAPTVGINSPVDNATFASPASVTISATAADADGTVTKVDFYNGTTLLGSDNTSPYTFTWNNVATGIYSLTAKATDNGALATASSAVVISVYTPNGAPTASITTPINNATFASPASVTISATAADADGTVTKVDFYNGTTLLGSDNTSPYTFTWNNVATGIYSLTAKATDNGALATASSAVVISVYTPNGAPTASITTPINNATFASPASVTISVTAADADGTVTKVDFYNGTTLLGSDNTSPYTFTWNNVATGNYSLTAKATDNGSLVTTSSNVVFSVYTPNGAPTASIATPINNATFASPASVTISATAADADGTITKVDFYNGTTLLGSDNTSPYTFTWNNVATGIYSLTAKATDNGSLATASSAVAISVYTPNGAPTVGITSPVNNATFASPASVTISATAADADGTVTKVDFYNGTTLLGSDNTSPYTFTWNNVATGNYSLTAKATDNGALATASSAVVFSVYTPNGAPTVGITSPIDNATFASPASVTISATAADADGTVTKVDFYNGTTLLGSDSASPYTFTWDSIPTGIYSLTAKGYDNAGLSTISSVIAGVVSSPLSFAFISFSGSPINQQIDLSWSTNNTGNTNYFIIEKAPERMALYTEIARVSAQSSLSTTLNYTIGDLQPTIGSNFYRIVQVDGFGQVVNSEALLINYVALNVAPTVSITNPTNNIKYTGPATINMSAIASDADGKISKVEFYNGTTLLVTEKYRPYTYTWNKVPVGNYTLTAKAYDNSGLVTTSASVSLSVVTQHAPTVSITNPVNNVKYTGPATINMSAIASDADGKISKVEFYSGSALLVTERYSPYTYTWNNVPAGNYTLTAKAYDNTGNITISAGVSISVNNSTLVIGDSVLNPIINSALASAPGMQNPGNYTEPVIKVGPNPASNTLSVFSTGLQKDEELRITIISISGVVQKSINTTTSNRVVQVDISSLVNGVYFIQVMSGDMIVHKQFVKQ